LLFDLLALKFDLRREGREVPSAREYLDRFPSRSRLACSARDASTSTLVVGYGLLVVASGLCGRVRLVRLTTLSAMAGYAVLALDASLRRVATDSNHHPNILLAALGVTGAVVAHLVRRIWAPSTYHYES
jgi:hypothetical protein